MLKKALSCLYYSRKKSKVLDKIAYWLQKSKKINTVQIFYKKVLIYPGADLIFWNNGLRL